VQATGWAVIFLSVISGHALYWTVVALAWLFVLVGSTFYFFSGLAYATSDRLTYWDFTARLLAEIHKMELRANSGQALLPAEEAGLGKKILDFLSGRSSQSSKQ
jgi:hypothetical protein